MVDAPSETTTRTGVHYPAHAQDPKWTDNFIKVLAEDLEKMVIPKFNTAIDRDTKIPPGTVAEGDACYLKDIDALQIYDGSAWQQVWPSTQPAITSGTAAPSGGSDGDVYFQYV